MIHRKLLIVAGVLGSVTLVALAWSKWGLMQRERVIARAGAAGAAILEGAGLRFTDRAGPSANLLTANTEQTQTTSPPSVMQTSVQA